MTCTRVGILIIAFCLGLSAAKALDEPGHKPFGRRVDPLRRRLSAHGHGGRLSPTSHLKHGPGKTRKAMSPADSMSAHVPQQAGPLFAPVTKSAPPSTFGPGVAHPVKPVNLVPGPAPVGTNKWYTQLVLAPAGTDPIYPLPYSLVHLNGTSLLSGPQTQFVGFGVGHTVPSQRTFGPDPSANPVRFYFNQQIISLVFGAQEINASNINGQLSSWSELTALWSLAAAPNASAAAARIDFPIARGAAFVTARYTSLTPTLRSSLNITSFSTLAAPVNGFTKSRVGYNDGSHWLIYARADAGSPPLNLTRATPTDLSTGQGKWTGVVQIVKMSTTYAPGGPEEAVYDKGVGVWVTGATITSGSIGSGQYGFQFATGGPRTSSAAPLVFALPHHVASLSTPSPVSPRIQLSTRVNGLATLYSGAKWTFDEKAATGLAQSFSVCPTNPTFAKQTAPTADDLAVLATVARNESAIDFSAESNLPTYYFSGKKLAKQALQCLAIHYVLKDAGLAASCLEKAKASFLQFVDGKQQAPPLVYESTWKGIISSGFLKDGNPADDFGNSLYNDHHFHWGYFIHAAATLSHLDPSFAGRVAPLIDSLVRDANSPVADAYFPFSRTFDWFVGHSWATGLESALDGKNEESSSEDINYFYGVKTWAEATGNAALAALADLQLAIMKRALTLYYLTTDANTIQPANFIRNRVPGITFENKVDHTTFFSTEKDAVHMIQAVPTTPILPYWRDPAWVAQDWDDSGVKGEMQVSALAQNRTNGYRTLLWTQYAVLQPRLVADGIKTSLNTTVLDDGASFTWSLAFALTQLGKTGGK